MTIGITTSVCLKLDLSERAEGQDLEQLSQSNQQIQICLVG
jgi:hypothetical protein